MILSKQLFQDKLSVPANFREIPTYKLLEICGFVEFPYSGFPLFHPIGKMMMENICDTIRREAQKKGFEEMYLPLVQKRRLLESTGRAKIFGNEFMELKENLEGYILAPTNEEVFIELAHRGLKSYRQLPVKIFQIAEKFRDIKKPKGILRSKQFLMCDMVSLDEDESSLKNSAAAFEELVNSVFSHMQLSPVRIEKNEGKYVDFLVPCKEGETKIVVHNGKASYAEENETNTVPSSSIAMYFIFEKFGQNQPKYQKKDGTLGEVFLGTYGLGIQRCFHAITETHLDPLGIQFPKAIRPFDVSILTMNPENHSQAALGKKYYDFLLERNLKVSLDNRFSKTLKEKAELSDFYGTPFKIIIGEKEVSSGTLTVKKRGNLKGQTIKAEPALIEEYLNG